MVNDKWKKFAAPCESMHILEQELTIYGLTVSELGALAVHQDKHDSDASMRFLLKSTLSKCPEIETPEDVDYLVENLSGKIGMDIINKVRELSGLEAPKNSPSTN